MSACHLIFLSSISLVPFPFSLSLKGQEQKGAIDRNASLNIHIIHMFSLFDFSLVNILNIRYIHPELRISNCHFRDEKGSSAALK